MQWTNAVYRCGNLVADHTDTAAAVLKTGMCNTVIVYRSLNGRSGHRLGSTDQAVQVPDYAFQSEAPAA